MFSVFWCVSGDFVVRAFVIVFVFATYGDGPELATLRKVLPSCFSTFVGFLVYGVVFSSLGRYSHVSLARVSTLFGFGCSAPCRPWPLPSVCAWPCWFTLNVGGSLVLYELFAYFSQQSGWFSASTRSHPFPVFE